MRRSCPVNVLRLERILCRFLEALKSAFDVQNNIHYVLKAFKNHLYPFLSIFIPDDDIFESQYIFFTHRFSSDGVLTFLANMFS